VTPRRSTSQPRFLFLAASVCLVEAAVAVGFGLVEASQVRVSRLVVGVGTALLMVGYGAFLAAVGRGVWLGRRWSRGPAVATQLIQIPIAWSFNGGDTAWVAWLLLGLSLLALVGLLTPASTAVFVDEPDAAADNALGEGGS